MWDLIVLFPDHCLSIYLQSEWSINVYAAVWDDNNNGNAIQMFEILLVACTTKNIWHDWYQHYVSMAMN